MSEKWEGKGQDREDLKRSSGRFFRIKAIREGRAPGDIPTLCAIVKRRIAEADGEGGPTDVLILYRY